MCKDVGYYGKMLGMCKRVIFEIESMCINGV